MQKTFILLRELDLSKNKIESIQKDDLEKLNLLKYLILSDNNIRYIETNTFDDLKQLIKLDLSKNKIKFIEKGHFNKLDELKYLLLSDNQISHIETDTFVDLKNFC